jgi:lysophospholipase L1-like esterase
MFSVPWRLAVATLLVMAGALLTGPVLRAAAPASAHKPVVYLIGDSTVKNGADNGSNGQWGWGHLLPYYFDKSKVTVENHAVGGTSSRTFMQTPSMWPVVVAKLQPGDFVIMQFGHNDGTAPPEKDTLRYRSTLRGNGEETVQGLVKSGGTETVHSFGWYMREFISQTKAKGATPIVCSLIPRNRWTAGKNNRNSKDYALWARQAAEQEHACFIPLNDLASDRYDALGQEKVTADYFPPGEAIHTNWAGAKLNAELVVEGIRSLKDCPLKNFLATDAKAPDEPDVKLPARGPRRGAATAPATDRPAAN